MNVALPGTLERKAPERERKRGRPVTTQSQCGAAEDFHFRVGRDAFPDRESPVSESPFAGGGQCRGIVCGHIVLLEKKTVIRGEQHVAPVDIRHLLDDQVQLVKGMLHRIESFRLRASRIAGFVDDVVKNVDDFVIAHEGTALSLGVQLQKLLGLKAGRLTGTGETQNLRAIRGARGASSIHGYRGSRSVHVPLLTRQQGSHAELSVGRERAKEGVHFCGPAVGGAKPLGKVRRRLVAKGIGDDDEHLLPLGEKRLHILAEKLPLGGDAGAFPSIQSADLIAPPVGQREEKVVHVGPLHPLRDLLHHLHLPVAAQVPGAAPVGRVDPPPTRHVTADAAGHGIHREIGGGQQFAQLHGLLQSGVAMLMLRSPEGSSPLLHRRTQVHGVGPFRE